MGVSKQASIVPQNISIILFVSNSHVHTSFGNDKHISKVWDQWPHLVFVDVQRFGHISPLV